MSKNSGIAERSLQQDFDEEVAYNAARRIFDWARDPEKRPFLLVASFTHPHDPYVTPRRFYDLYRHDEIDMPRVPFIAPDKRDPHSRRLFEQYDRGEIGITDEDVRTARHAYYGSISYVDERIGEVIDALRRSKLLDDTIVIFCADHGDMIGERGLWYKMSFYDWSARVPLIMAGPGVTKAHRIKANCSLVDILPTLVEIAAGDNWPGYPDPPDGQSLLPLFTADDRDRVAVSELMSEGVAAPYVMIRKGRYKFTFVEHDPPQLFDMDGGSGRNQRSCRRPGLCSGARGLPRRSTAALGSRQAQGGNRPQSAAAAARLSSAQDRRGDALGLPALAGRFQTLLQGLPILSRS